MSLSGKERVRDSKHADEASSPPSSIQIGDLSVIDETAKTADGDEALRFLKNQHDVGEMTPEEEKKLVRKIDWMIMPLMWSCYCLQYLDKTLGKSDASPTSKDRVLTPHSHS
jgi:hypothetical protein